MEEWFNLLKPFLYQFGYVIIFLMIVLESIPLIGVVIPGGLFALLAAGIFSRFGIFNPLTAFAVCIAATLLIDHAGYILGRVISRKKFHKIVSNFFIKESLLRRIGKLIGCHTGKSLILGRLNPPTRAIVPFVVGNEKIKYLKFLFFAAISALVWVSIFFSIGFLFADSLSKIDSATKLVTWTVIFLIIGIYIYYVVKNNYFTKGGLNGADCKKQN